MSVRITLFAVAILCIVAAPHSAADGFPANPAFVDGERGWALPEGAKIEPADGAQGNALTFSDGWVLSDPSDREVSGWQAMRLRARAVGGAPTDRLLLALPGAEDAPSARAAVTAGAVGSRWREIAAELPVAAGPVRIAVGAEGDATWLIDRIELASASLPDAVEAEDLPIFEPHLPAGWEPDGLLDAVERGLGRGRELVVGVGALRIGFAPEVSAERGHRGALRLTVANGAASARELSVSVAGPPGFFAPRRTVNIRGGGTTVFDASLQAFFVGRRALRVTFASGGEEASAPVLVEVTPSYPAAGVAFTGEQPSAEDIAALAELDLQLVAARAPAGDAALLSQLPAHLTRLLLLAPPWSEDALRTSTSALIERGGFAALHHLRAETLPERARAITLDLRRALDDAEDPVYLLSPPLDLQPGSRLSIDERDRAIFAELAGARAIAAPALRLPVVQSTAVGAVTVDERAVSVPQPAWSEIAVEPELGAIVSGLRESARLPMFFADIAGRSAGSEIADAMTLARLLTICVYQGATGFTISARPSDAPEGADAFCPLDDDGTPRELISETVAELSRELAAAVPLRVLQQSEEIGTGPNVSVGFRPFMRGDEGMLALWNNTAAPIDLIYEVRTEPLDVHTVSVGLHGVSRHYRGSFHFSEDAIALNRPVLFVTLAPHEFRFISMQLVRAHAGWLASIERKPPIPVPDGRPRSFRGSWEQRFDR